MKAPRGLSLRFKKDRALRKRAPEPYSAVSVGKEGSLVYERRGCKL